MKAFYVEGLVNRKARRGGNAGLEPVSLTIWAETAEDALREASAQLAGVQWVEGPRLARQSEEQRMRAAGAPTLPGLEEPKKKKHG